MRSKKIVLRNKSFETPTTFCNITNVQYKRNISEVYYLTTVGRVHVWYLDYLVPKIEKNRLSIHYTTGISEK